MKSTTLLASETICGYNYHVLLKVRSTPSIKACSLLLQMHFLTKMQLKSEELIIFSTVVSNFFHCCKSVCEEHLCVESLRVFDSRQYNQSQRLLGFLGFLVCFAWSSLKRCLIYALNTWKRPPDRVFAGVELDFYFGYCNREDKTILLLLFAWLWFLVIMNIFF